mmetsp:Transcript_21885/g.61182  ORF Transcript_21885/g.61182 Transcript_21885/m.61182 type:complete len:243 (-) Transcript_21885:504-1232(-)
MQRRRHEACPIRVEMHVEAAVAEGALASPVVEQLARNPSHLNLVGINHVCFFIRVHKDDVAGHHEEGLITADRTQAQVLSVLLLALLSPRADAREAEGVVAILEDAEALALLANALEADATLGVFHIEGRFQLVRPPLLLTLGPIDSMREAAGIAVCAAASEEVPADRPLWWPNGSPLGWGRVHRPMLRRAWRCRRRWRRGHRFAESYAVLKLSNVPLTLAAFFDFLQLVDLHTFASISSRH